jgi:hypothetical protein
MVFTRNNNKYILSLDIFFLFLFFFYFMLVTGNNVFLNFILKLEEPSQQWKESVALVWPVFVIAKKKCSNWLWMLCSAIFVQNVVQYSFPKMNSETWNSWRSSVWIVMYAICIKNGSSLGLYEYISRLRNSPG